METNKCYNAGCTWQSKAHACFCPKADVTGDPATCKWYAPLREYRPPRQRYRPARENYQPRYHRGGS